MGLPSFHFFFNPASDRSVMPGKLVWAGVAATAILVYRRLRSCAVDKSLLKANFGERVESPDDTRAVVAILPNDRGIELYIRCWGVDRLASPRGVVLLIHGGMWHSRYFAPFARELVSKGYVVYTYDLQAHGLSGSAQGVRGDFTSFADVVDDTQGVVEFARSNHTGAPFFVYGESMGSLILLLWELEYGKKENVNGLILAGSVVGLKQEMKPPRLMVPVLGLMAKLFPKLRVPSDEYEASFDEAFGDQAVAAAARKDPLVIFDPPTLRIMFQALMLFGVLEKELSSVSTPMLVMHGLSDIRVDWKNSQRVYDEVSSVDKSIKLYEGMKHQLLQEVPENRSRVFTDIINWLNGRTADPPLQKPRKTRRGQTEFDLPDMPFPAIPTDTNPNPPADP